MLSWKKKTDRKKKRGKKRQIAMAIMEKRQKACAIMVKRQIACAITERRQITCAFMAKPLS